MTKEEILTVLKSINYPGFSRDIVSFGMVREVAVTDESVSITLEVATTNDDQKSKLIESVRFAVSDQLGVQSVGVDIIKPAKKEQATQPGGQNMPTPASIPGIKHTIAIASGKGGVGKSTVTINLAATLAKTGATVGVLDLDIYGPSLPLIAGINERPVLDEEQKIVPIEAHGIKLMSFGFISGNKAPTIWRGPMVSKMTQQFFEDVAWGELDYLFLDLPPGTGDIQLTLTQHLALTGAVIVTTPQELALLDVRKGADMFAKVNTPVLGVVENMSALVLKGTIRDAMGKVVQGGTVDIEGLGELGKLSTDSDGKFQVSVPLFGEGGGESESSRLDVPLLGTIPLSPEIMLASDAGTPFVIEHPDSPAALEFQRIAQAIVEAVN